MIHAHNLCRPCYDAQRDHGFFLPLNVPGTWADEALCAQSDPDLWFPEKGIIPYAARRICFRCPVRRQCLDYIAGIEENLPVSLWGGIYAGYSVRERRRLYAERAA